MTSRLTIAGAALLAAVALSAMAVATASAQNKTDHITAPEPWTPTASSIGNQVYNPTTFSGKVRRECEEVSATVTASISTTVDKIAVTPFTSKCKAFNQEGSEAAVFVDNGGCEYIFTGKTTTGNPTGGEHATVHIDKHEKTGEFCEIKMTATALKFKCAAVPNQEVRDAAKYEQGAGTGNEKDIVINITAHGITNTTERSIACPTEKGGETEVHNDGSYVGKMTLKGHNGKGEPVPLTLTETATP